MIDILFRGKCLHNKYSIQKYIKQSEVIKSVHIGGAAGVVFMSRVTSVELDEADVEYIEKLMREDRVRSLKEFVEKCVRFGRRFTLDRWQPGIFNVGPVRVVLMPKRALDMLVEHVSEDDYEDVGREIGDITRSFALFQYQVDTSVDWDTAIEIMSEAGLGQFLMSSKDVIQVLSPLFPSGMMKSYIETVLGVQLEATRLKIDVQLFKILSKKPVGP